MIVSHKPVHRGIILPLIATFPMQVSTFLESNAGVLNCLVTIVSPHRYMLNKQGLPKVVLLFSVCPSIISFPTAQAETY